jgi:hypothetical protein
MVDGDRGTTTTMQNIVSRALIGIDVAGYLMMLCSNSWGRTWGSHHLQTMKLTTRSNLLTVWIVLLLTVALMSKQSASQKASYAVDGATNSSSKLMSTFPYDL